MKEVVVSLVLLGKLRIHYIYIYIYNYSTLCQLDTPKIIVTNNVIDEI